MIIRTNNKEQWLQIRQQGIGSSEVATLLGYNPYQTPYQLWQLKKGLIPPQEESQVMKRGHFLEEGVAHFWEDATGKKVIKASQGDWIIRDDKRPYLQVSPDRTYWLDYNEGKGKKGILECKTANDNSDIDNFLQLHPNWFCQLQYQLGVAKMSRGYLACLCWGSRFFCKEYTFNEAYFNDYILPRVDAFWNDCILGDKEPEVITADDVALKYATHCEGKSIEVDAELYETYDLLCLRKSEKKDLEAEIKVLEDKLKLAFGDAEQLTYEGKVLATWKNPSAKDVFDEKRFQTQHPDLYQSYLINKQGSRRFLVK